MGGVKTGSEAKGFIGLSCKTQGEIRPLTRTRQQRFRIHLLTTNGLCQAAMH